MSSAFRQLLPLYRGTFLFGVACGISLALTPLSLNGSGFDKEEMGTLALFFAAGLVLFSLPAGKLLHHLGARTTLSWALFGYALCVVVFPHASDFASIAAVRFLDGVCSICIWVGSETVVLSRSDEKHKAHLTSLYAIWLACGYVTGPLVARLLTPTFSHEQLFTLAGAVALAAALYWSRGLTRDVREHGPKRISEDAGKVALSTSFRALAFRTKTSCLAVFSYGYFQSAVVLFLPLYLMESKGVPEADTIVLPGLFCLGMLLLSNWVGRRADALGHLFFMRTLSILGTCCILGFVLVDGYFMMCTLVFLAGATLAAMSPVALALLGAMVPQADLGRANALYNTFYAAGILLGPPVASVIFARAGGAMMLYHLAALWAVFVLFSLVFIADDPAWRSRRMRPSRASALSS